MRKSSNLTILGKLELHGTGNLFHSTGLGSRSDTGHGQTNVDSWPNTLVEQLGFQENLSVSNGNDVGRDVCRYVTSLKVIAVKLVQEIIRNQKNDVNKHESGLLRGMTAHGTCSTKFCHPFKCKKEIVKVNNYLGLNDWQSGKRTTSVHFVHFSGTLKETRMQVEDVTRVGLATRRTTQQQGHLTISNGLLGQIVVDDQSVLAIVAEILTLKNMKIC